MKFFDVVRLYAKGGTGKSMILIKLLKRKAEKNS